MEQDNERKYLWSWNSGADGTNDITSIQMIAMREFGEVGMYTEEDCKLLCKILHDTPAPTWLKWEWLPDGTNTQETNRKNAEEYGKTIMEKFNELKDK